MYRFALIGCGTVSAFHREQLKKYGKLVAVCDVVPQKAKLIAEEEGIAAYYGIDEMLEAQKDIDLICICTPNGLHAEHCIKSLQAGKHVICESPLCLTAAAAWQMIETEKFCRKKLFVIHTGLLKSPDDIIRPEQKTNGQPHSFDMQVSDTLNDDETNWRQQIFPGGGMLYAYFTNAMDALITTLGPVDEIYPVGGKARTALDKEGVVKLKMKSGLAGSLRWKVQKGLTGNSFDLQEGGKSSKSTAFLKNKMDEEDYAHLYPVIMQMLEKDEPSNLYQAMQSVEAIEKIYKALSPNPAASS